jgi:hypothetical protein
MVGIDKREAGGSDIGFAIALVMICILILILMCGLGIGLHELIYKVFGVLYG